MTDIRLVIEFWDHPKTVKLERRLGIEGVKSLQVLWLWCRANKPDGILTGMDAEDIEIAARWQGEPERFVNESLTLRWLDLNGDTYALHDWHDHNPWSCQAETRGDKARFSLLAKTRPKTYEKMKADGKTSITKAEYREILASCSDSLANEERTVNESQSERKTTVNDCLAPAPAPSPSPSPTHNVVNKTLCASTDARREDFEKFWEAFDYKKGKEPAWKSWKKITHYKPSLVETIIAAAEREARKRPSLIADKKTPKMAQGWITDKRWQDEDEQEAKTYTTPKSVMDDWEPPHLAELRELHRQRIANGQ